MFVVRHSPIFVYFGVDAENPGSERGVSSDIPELSERGEDEGGGVVPSPGILVGGVNALACHVARPVISGLRVGVVAAGGEVLGYPALSRKDSADLPAADDGIQESVTDVQRLSLADGQLIEGRHYQAIARVE